MQLIERVAWMPGFGIQYIVGIDGISLFLVLLTTFLMPLAVLASWSVRERVKEYLIFMLLLETGMLGAFVHHIERQGRKSGSQLVMNGGGNGHACELPLHGGKVKRYVFLSFTLPIP